MSRAARWSIGGARSGEPATEVILITGAPRSGSTLLERALGARTGVPALGEVCYLWERGVVGGERCGCGLPFWDCAFWQSVARGAGVCQGDPMNDGIAGRQRWLCRFRRIPGALWREPTAATRRHLDLLGRVYRAAGTRVLDSSKEAPYVFWLARLAMEGQIGLRVVHLVRDPRAVAHSWQRVRIRPEVPGDRAYMPRFGPWRSARDWLLTNIALEAARYSGLPWLRIRYEDFAGNPGVVLETIADFAGFPQVGNAASGSLSLPAHHTVAGNPVRFTVGPLEVRVDDEWRQGLSPVSSALVTALCAPVMTWYGYSLRRFRATGGPPDEDANPGHAAEPSRRAGTPASAGS